jgi:hypothetical protein
VIFIEQNWAAHRAEMSDLAAVLRQVSSWNSRAVSGRGQVELVLPAEVEAGLEKRVVAPARPGWPLATSAACAAILYA